MRNPFIDGSITGEFEQDGSSNRVIVDGFCDSTDGSLYRVRFMPTKTGSYIFHVTVKAGQQTESHSGTFTATDRHLRGPLRVDPAYPWHFIWEGTGEHYFFNGTTAYWLMGWRDERSIRYSIDRLATTEGQPACACTSPDEPAPLRRAGHEWPEVECQYRRLAGAGPR